MTGAQGSFRIGEKDRAIAAYHDELARYEAQRVEHEGALPDPAAGAVSAVVE